MSNIDLKEFVNINIIRHPVTQIEHLRDTVILYTPEAHKPNLVDNVDTYTGLISSLAEAMLYFDYSESDVPQAPLTLAYLTMYFNNSGIKVKVIEYDDTVMSDNYVTNFKEAITQLENKYICINIIYPSTVTVANQYNNNKNIALALNEVTSGINEKFILTRVDDTVGIDETKVKNFVVKYSNTLGAEMTTSAYLSNINVYGYDTVYDYAFTEEKIKESNINTDTFKTLMDNNYNVDVNLANSVRDCGGNCKDGEDMVNKYVLIILHQTLTDVLVNLLSQKLKDSKGVSQIYATISQELEKYLNCGYLSTDKIWTYEDYVVNVNGIDYTIIQKGTPLVKGYSITVLPFSSLTDADKAKHLAPQVYVILADQYGIRKITVTGEVF